MVNWDQIVQAILFALFAGLTGLLHVLIAPTYNNLLVPELAANSLYPALASSGVGTGFLQTAVPLSGYLLSNLVDPAITLVLLGVGLAYLARSFASRLAARLEPALPRLVVGIVGANFTLPIAGALLDLGRATFGVVTNFDGGAWQIWANIVPSFGVGFAWDNGVLAFVVTFALFTLVLLLAVVVALRDALLSVVLVLLPVFTLLWPIPAVSALARRGWLLLVELTFVPVVMVVPLELAVGAPSILFVLGYLAAALGSPYLISVARAQLGGLGFSSAGGALSGGIQRGLAVGSLGLQSAVSPLVSPSSSAGRTGLGAATSLLGKAPLPVGVALAAGQLASHASVQLFRHMRKLQSRPPSVSAHPARTMEGLSGHSIGGPPPQRGSR